MHHGLVTGQAIASYLAGGERAPSVLAWPRASADVNVDFEPALYQSPASPDYPGTAAANETIRNP